MRGFLLPLPLFAGRSALLVRLGLVHHGAYVGVACHNNSEVSGLVFTDNALWMWMIPALRAITHKL